MVEDDAVVGSVMTFSDATAHQAKTALLRLVAKELSHPLDAESLKTLANLLSS